mgnify:CR=1 FL=1
MTTQQYALVPVEKLKELKDLDGVIEQIPDDSEEAKEMEKRIKDAEKEGKIKTYTKEQFFKKYRL